MKILVTGANGQLGRALCTLDSSQYQLVGFDSRTLDVCDPSAIEEKLNIVQPDFVFNAAAYTAVDQAEDDAGRAYEVNATAVGHLASACLQYGAKLVHFSTDYVFDGMNSSPYLTDDQTNPQSVYGASKLAGEQLIGDDALIIRTSWVYDALGKNFVTTVLKLLGEHARLTIVSDQVGSPTSATSLAKTSLLLAAKGAKGVYHVTDEGVASWYDFAIAIQEEALSLGLLQNERQIIPIRTTDYPTRAKRPSYSVLDKSKTRDLLGGQLPYWRSQLRLILKDLI